MIRPQVARVDGLIDELGLRKSAHTLIGGFFRRGISGARARVFANASYVLTDD